MDTEPHNSEPHCIWLLCWWSLKLPTFLINKQINNIVWLLSSPPVVTQQPCSPRPCDSYGRSGSSPRRSRASFRLQALQPQATSGSSQLFHTWRSRVPSNLESSQAVFLVGNEEPCGFFTVQLHFPSTAAFVQWS